MFIELFLVSTCFLYSIIIPYCIFKIIFTDLLQKHVKKNEENVEDSKVNVFILYKRILCNFKIIQIVTSI